MFFYRVVVVFASLAAATGIHAPALAEKHNAELTVRKKESNDGNDGDADDDQSKSTTIAVNSAMNASSNNTSSAAPKTSAEHRALEKAAKAKLSEEEKALAKLKTKHLALMKEHSEELEQAQKENLRAKELETKLPRGCRKTANNDIDLDGHVSKAKLLARKEALKRVAKERADVKKHAMMEADHASKQLIGEEHNALRGKLKLEVLKIAKVEAARVAPHSAAKEVLLEYSKIRKHVKEEVKRLVIKDTTATARALAMKEVKDQMSKSSTVKDEVAQVAKEVTKYFVHKFADKEVTRVVGEEAGKQVPDKLQQHTEAELGKAEESAKAKVRSSQAGRGGAKCKAAKALMEEVDDEEDLEDDAEVDEDEDLGEDGETKETADAEEEEDTDEDDDSENDDDTDNAVTDGEKNDGADKDEDAEKDEDGTEQGADFVERDEAEEHIVVVEIDDAASDHKETDDAADEDENESGDDNEDEHDDE